LFLRLADKSAFFQLGVEMHGPAVGAGAQSGAFGQTRHGFEYLYQRLRRFQPARIHFDN
jgi:hypothetical protein